MKKKLFFVRALCVLLAVSAVFGALWVAGRVLQPKYLTSSREGSMAAEYYDDVAEVTHDVLFVGDCEVFESYIPAVLWQEYGISSCIRGSAQQLIWHSYYMLEDALSYETPEVVVYNVQSLKYGVPQNEAYNRMALDGMRWSGTKVRAIRDAATEEDSMLSYLLPALRFHSRWDELTSEDWRYAFGGKPTVTFGGYLLQTGVEPAVGNDEDLKPTLLDPTLPEMSMAWLDRLADLCEEKGIRLVLVKAPTNNFRYWWYDEWDEQVSAYAAVRGLSYYNTIPQAEEIGIDWSTDTYDAGIHLNLSGAVKLTHWFGRVLSEEIGVPDRRDDAAVSAVWEERVKHFQAAAYPEDNS